VAKLILLALVAAILLIAGCASSPPNQAGKNATQNASANVTVVEPPPSNPPSPPPARPPAKPPVELPVPKWCSVWVASDTLSTGDEIFVLVNVSEGRNDSAGVFCNNTMNWTNASLHWTERQVFLGRGILHKFVACEFREPGNFSILATIDNEICASKKIFVSEPYLSILHGNRQYTNYTIRDWSAIEESQEQGPQ